MVIRGSRKFCKRGSNFDNVFFLSLFLVDEGREDPNTKIRGPSSVHPSAKRWRADDDPTLNAGLVAL